MLDRDGVLNVDSGYVGSAHEWKWLPGAPEAIVALANAGYFLAIITNQSGVARKKFSKLDYKLLMEWVEESFDSHVNPGSRGLFPEIVATCFHGPDDGCNCRKPKTGLWDQIKGHFSDVDLSQSWYLDDKFDNLEFGRKLGTKLGLITDDLHPGPRADRDYSVFSSLRNFASTILGRRIPWLHVTNLA